MVYYSFNISLFFEKAQSALTEENQIPKLREAIDNLSSRME